MLAAISVQHASALHASFCSQHSLLQTFASLNHRDALGHTHHRQPAARQCRSVVQLASNTEPRYLLPTSPTKPSFRAPALFDLFDLTSTRVAWTDSTDRNFDTQQKCSRKLRPATMPFRHPRPSQRRAAPAIAVGSARSNAMHKSLAGPVRKRQYDAHTYNHRRRRDPRACGVRGYCMHCDE
jgi:hypothetical protein